jgi:hypothetical protein
MTITPYGALLHFCKKLTLSGFLVSDILSHTKGPKRKCILINSFPDKDIHSTQKLTHFTPDFATEPGIFLTCGHAPLLHSPIGVFIRVLLGENDRLHDFCFYILWHPPVNYSHAFSGKEPCSPY